MRFTQGTIATLTCGILLLLVLWLQPETPAVSNAVAETEREDARAASVPSTTDASISRSVTRQQTVAKPDVPWSSADKRQSRVEAKLSELIPEITFDYVPLHEVIAELTKLTDIPIHFDPAEVGDIIDPEIPIYLEADANSMTFDTLIQKYILEPLDLVFVIRDNHLEVMSYDKWLTVPESTKVVVYDCRDLVGAAALSSDTRDRLSERLREMANRRIGAGATSLTIPPPSASELRFMWVIVNTVSPGSWVLTGRYVPNPEQDWHDIYGTINCLDGLLVVRHTREVHADVEELLQKLRAVKR